MSMMFCITGAELRKALAEIEAAERNGFMHCLAVYKMTEVSPMLSGCRAAYSDLCERAHPTDGSLDWGRFQGVSRRFKFHDGELVPIKKPQVKAKIASKKKRRR